MPADRFTRYWGRNIRHGSPNGDQRITRVGSTSARQGVCPWCGPGGPDRTPPMSDPALLEVTPIDMADTSIREATPYYIIATAPRTGSTLLAEALTATRQAGAPDEVKLRHPSEQ